MDAKTYEIGGKIYSQKPLVLGRLIDLIESFDVEKLQTATTAEAVKALVGASPKMLSIVLRDEDQVQADEEALRENLDMKTLTEVVEDFLSFNRDLSSLGRLVRLRSETEPAAGAEGPERTSRTEEVPEDPIR